MGGKLTKKFDIFYPPPKKTHTHKLYPNSTQCNKSDKIRVITKVN